MVWAYLGPRELQPPPPDHELVRAPADASPRLEDVRGLQLLAGARGRDRSDARDDPAQREDRRPHVPQQVRRARRAARHRHDRLRLHVRRHSRAPEFDWVRVYHWIMPSYHMRGSVAGLFKKPGQIPTINGHIWIPIDDYTTWVYSFTYSADPAQPISHDHVLEHETRLGRGTTWGPGTCRCATASNDYLIDRQLQKTESMTGIAGVNTQDFALQEGMGAIVDRSKEHVGTTDRAIILLRKILLENRAGRKRPARCRRSIRRPTGICARWIARFPKAPSGKSSANPISWLCFEDAFRKQHGSAQSGSLRHRLVSRLGRNGEAARPHRAWRSIASKSRPASGRASACRRRVCTSTAAAIIATRSCSTFRPAGRRCRSAISTKRSSTSSKATAARKSSCRTARSAASSGARQACSPSRSTRRTGISTAAASSAR